MSLRAPSALVEGLLFTLLAATPLAFGCVEPWSQSLLEIACFGLAFLCLFRSERQSPSFFPLAAVGALLAIGSAQRLSPISPLAPQPRGPFTVSLRATDEALLLWAAYGALAWSVPRVIRDWASAQRFAWAVVASGTLVALVGIAQEAAGVRELYGLRYTDSSPFGPYYNQDHAAALMAVSFCLALSFFIARLRVVRSSWRAAPPDWLRAQAGTGLALALLLVGLVSCGSRGATLGLSVGGGAMFFLAARFMPEAARRRRIYFYLTCAWALGLFLGYLAFQWEISALGKMEASTAHRLSMYKSSLRMLGDAPLFGWGLGAVRLVFGAYQQTDVVGVVEHVHSDWLELALQGGFMGLFLVLPALSIFWLKTLRAWWSAPSREARALIGGGLGAMLVFAVHSLVDFCSQIPANAAVVFAIMGWLSCVNIWSDKAPARRGSWPRWRWALAPVFAGLVMMSAKPAIAAWYARQADLAPPESRGAFLIRAKAWDARAEYSYRLGLNYFDLGMANPSARAALMSSGLPYAKAAVALEPLNPDFLFLEGALLWRLGRAAEARDRLAQAQRRRFGRILPNHAPTYNEKAQAKLKTLDKLNLLPDELRPH